MVLHFTILAALGALQARHGFLTGKDILPGHPRPPLRSTPRAEDPFQVSATICPPTHTDWHPWCTSPSLSDWVSGSGAYPDCSLEPTSDPPFPLGSPSAVPTSEGISPLRHLSYCFLGLPDEYHLASWANQASTSIMWEHPLKMASYPTSSGHLGQDISFSERRAQSAGRPSGAALQTPPEAPISTIWSAFSLSV